MNHDEVGPEVYQLRQIATALEKIADALSAASKTNLGHDFHATSNSGIVKVCRRCGLSTVTSVTTACGKRNIE